MRTWAIVGTAIASHILSGTLVRAQLPTEENNELKNDQRLKSTITRDFIRPRVREVLDCLEKATGVKLSCNDMVDMRREAFGSLSFRNTPAWVIMGQLARSDAVRGHWEKEADGYRLNGTLDAAVIGNENTDGGGLLRWWLTGAGILVFSAGGLLALRHFRTRRTRQPEEQAAGPSREVAVAPKPALARGNLPSGRGTSPRKKK